MSPIVETSTGWVLGMIWVAVSGAVAGGIGAVASWLGATLGLG